MGAGATAGAGTSPAKFSFNVGMVNCITPTPPAGQQPDLVTYNTSVTSTAATRVGTFLSEPATGSTITITNGANTLTMTAGGANANTGTGTGTYARSSYNTTTIATHLAAALNLAGNGSYVGITATSSTNTVTITAIKRLAETGGASSGIRFRMGGRDARRRTGQSSPPSSRTATSMPLHAPARCRQRTGHITLVARY